MKKLSLIYLIIIIAACSESDLEIRDNPKITSLNGTWRVTAYYDLDANEIIKKDSINSWGLDVVVTFDDQSSPPKITGKNTTNSMTGAFEYIDDRKFRVFNLASTKVNEPQWGVRFRNLISDELTFEINESQLKIKNDQKQLIGTLEKQ